MLLKYRIHMTSIFLLALIMLSFCPNVCMAWFSNSILEETLDDMGNSGLSQPMIQMFEEVFRQEKISFNEFIHDILAGKGASFKECLNMLSAQVLGDFAGYAKILGQIILVGVTISCLNILGKTMAPDGASQIAETSAYMVLVLIAIFSFKDILGLAAETVENLRAAFFAFIPVVTSMVMISGAPVTAGVLHPTIFGMGTFVSVFILDIAFPLIFTSITVDMAGNFGGGERVSGIAEMLRQIAFIGMGILLVAFVGVVTGERAAAGVADTIALRTAKYMSSTFIPVAGKMVGDTMDMFFHSLFALRSAVGLAGSIVILGVVFSPLVKVVACFVAWRAALAVLGPTCGSRVRRSLHVMASGVGFLAITLFSTSFIFIICLSLIAQAAKAF